MQRRKSTASRSKKGGLLASGKKKNELQFTENCHFLQIQSFLETYTNIDDENQKLKPNGNSVKPQKFSISTKFLRKSRYKLKTARLNGATAVSEISAIRGRSTSDVENFGLYNNENAKFKDFSIDSLLNK